MRELEAARTELLAAVAPLPAESLPLDQAAGRVLAEAPTSRHPLPSFDNSAMDGFAVRAADLQRVPVSLQVVATVAAGGCCDRPLRPGEAIRLFTGAPLPAGADAVVRQEDTSPDPADAGRVMVHDSVRPWDNVRFRGEDVLGDAPLLEAGTPLGPGALGLLAAAGVATVRVHQSPRIAVLVTGNELAPPGTPPGPGQIHESNSLMLAELIRRCGAVPVCFPPVPDDVDLIRKALQRAFAETDLVLTAGGASVGEHDLVKPALAGLGGRLEFWRLALKPGKPFFHGRLGSQHLLGVPGNPVSAFVTTVLLALPAVRRLQGRAHCQPPTSPAKLSEPFGNPDARRHFVRVVTDADGTVRPSGMQASHRLASLALADGLVDVPPRCTLAAGTILPVVRWP